MVPDFQEGQVCGIQPYPCYVYIYVYVYVYLYTYICGCIYIYIIKYTIYIYIYILTFLRAASCRLPYVGPAHPNSIRSHWSLRICSTAGPAFCVECPGHSGRAEGYHQRICMVFVGFLESMNYELEICVCSFCTLDMSFMPLKRCKTM